MTDVLTLFNPDFEAVEFETQRKLTLKERFCLFHALNPQVHDELERMAQALVDRGRTRVGIKCLVETLRWQFYMTTTDPSSRFKINNSYSSFYARLLLDEHPSWADLFELRQIERENP